MNEQNESGLPSEAASRSSAGLGGCMWSEDGDGIWSAECGEETSPELAFCFNDGGPVENDFVFCPFCGNVLIIKTLSDA